MDIILIYIVQLGESLPPLTWTWAMPQDHPPDLCPKAHYLKGERRTTKIPPWNFQNSALDTGLLDLHLPCPLCTRGSLQLKLKDCISPLQAQQSQVWERTWAVDTLRWLSALSITLSIILWTNQWGRLGLAPRYFEFLHQSRARHPCRWSLLRAQAHLPWARFPPLNFIKLGCFFLTVASRVRFFVCGRLEPRNLSWDPLPRITLWNRISFQKVLFCLWISCSYSVKFIPNYVFVFYVAVLLNTVFLNTWANVEIQFTQQINFTFYSSYRFE